MGICLAVWLVPSGRTGLTRVEDGVNPVSNLCQLGYFPSLVCPSAKRSDFVTVLIFLRPETRNTFTKGWSEAYGLFLKGEAPMVLSYTTSPAYHRHIENSERYRVAMFDDGHYQQVEVIARLASSKNPTLAQNFLEFMLSNDVQKILPTTNWMLPAVKTGQALPEAFKESEIPKVVLGFTPEEVSANRKNWIKRWLGAVAK